MVAATAVLRLVARLLVRSLGFLRRRIATEEETEGAKARAGAQARQTTVVEWSTEALPSSASAIDLGRTRA